MVEAINSRLRVECLRFPWQYGQLPWLRQLLSTDFAFLYGRFVVLLMGSTIAHSPTITNPRKRLPFGPFIVLCSGTITRASFCLHCSRYLCPGFSQRDTGLTLANNSQPLRLASQEG
jgi:hypothetical protein